MASHQPVRIVLIALAVLCINAALAQGFPDRPIRIVVPYLAGGGVDTTARLVGQRLGENVGQPVVVDNRPGAATNIGSDLVAKSKPDGYTLLLANSSQVANVSIYPKMPYDLMKDLAPVTLIGVTPIVLVVHPSLPVKSAKELVALAKSRPGELTYASAGIGSPTHIAPELFKYMARVNMLHVPYKGGSQAVIDLIAGRVTMYFAATPTAFPLIKAGKLRALGVTSPRRYPGAPEIPTIAESGVPGYELVGWFALLAPAGTPQEVIAKLHAGTAKALQTPELAKRFAAEGVETSGAGPRELDQFLRKEIEKYRKIVQVADIRPE
ncbi:MAG TPA: tripartite tricarboxylate transporter substrate binding protein [Burkholderiales bacterium]|nr:tripartite tricarboxylate transporter substrate binding protein [Burkholderiales bacterium]